MSFIGKLIIAGEIEILSGLHIGTGQAGGIGLIDNPVVRDPLTRRPLIPGSSLKGRLRHALETLLGSKSPDVCRLFGAAPEDEVSGLTRLYVRDSHLLEESARKLEGMETDALYVEIKTENRIDRATGTAEHPRQSERLPAGARLNLELVYNMYSSDDGPDDLQNLKAALDLVEDEYLGGSGSRGYGRVRFQLNSLSWRTLDDYLQGRKAVHRDTDTDKWISDAANLLGLVLPVRA